MRVLIAAGGTAGHINPALAIAGALKKADPTAEIHFAGRKEGMEYRLVTQAGYPFHHIEITGFQRKLSLHKQDLSKMTDQTVQSLYAIGSGGLKGLGLGNSVEKQLWLPESTNDFIFSVVCEELGFIGAVLIIVLFVLFIVQGLLIAYKAENL